ncbi:hypothetical protein FRC07_006527 [Ceratobasidium sp. 392]|nr:hypothetical protein FRC07_006527 [Ceratobasidium sp. 392]
MAPTTLDDAIKARQYWKVARLRREPAIEQLNNAIRAAMPRKPEWGRPIVEYIHDLPAYNAPAPSESLIRAALDTIQQSDEHSLSRPTYPANMLMLIGTKVLSSCTLLLREHIQDTQEPVFFYEYGYLCFQVMVLAIQVALLKAQECDTFDGFMLVARKCPPREIPEALSMQTTLVISLCNHELPGKGLFYLLDPSSDQQGRMIALPAVGGMNSVDGLFLVNTLWESRKQLSYIVSKTPTPGWIFPLQVFALLLRSIKKENIETTWTYLENLCHRYGLGSGEEDLPALAETCITAAKFCINSDFLGDSYRMEDEEDARTVVESYVARMTPRPGKGPLPQVFCSTLIDFVFGERISTLGELLHPMIRVGYERVWLDLLDEKVARDTIWGVNLAQLAINVFGSTESVAEIEAFVPPLYDVNIVGLIGQVLLMPTNLPPDGIFAQTLAYSKSSAVAEKLFADEYSSWHNTLKYIRLQILNNPDRDESLRGNAAGAELAWTNVGKIFGFTERMTRTNKSQTKLLGAHTSAECGNPRNAEIALIGSKPQQSLELETSAITPADMCTG